MSHLRFAAVAATLLLSGYTDCQTETSPFEGVTFVQFTTKAPGWELAEDGSAVICFKGVWPLEWASYQDDEETPGVDLHLLVDWIPDESAGVERGLWVPMDPETGYFEGCLSLVTGDPPGAVLTDGVCPILAYLDLELSAERYLAGQFLEVRDTTMVFQAWDVTGL